MRGATQPAAGDDLAALDRAIDSTIMDAVLAQRSGRRRVSARLFSTAARLYASRRRLVAGALRTPSDRWMASLRLAGRPARAH